MTDDLVVALLSDDTPETIRNKFAQLQEQNRRLERINGALMRRVESQLDAQGNDFASFQTAIALEHQVKERTTALKVALEEVEHANRELVASNEAALEASRAKSAFLAAMSHELRTPMNGVVGMTELLLTTALDEQQLRSTKIIQRSALSLLQILNDILDFSKIEAGALTMERTPFDAREALDHALQPLTPQIEHKGLSLAVEWDETLPRRVLGDSLRFAQLLTNLVANAVKFTAEGEVRVRASRVAGSESPVRARFEIRDTGIGISESLLPKLFEKFVQADSTTTRMYGGTGLGLAIVRRIAEAMGGSCGASSEEGAGSCFWFELPFEAAEAEAEPVVTRAKRSVAAPGHAPEDAPEDLRSLHVLVVEDNPVNQAVARGFLSSLGYRCSMLVNGREAVDALTVPHSFDMVMMDWQMPVLDGLAATRLVREYEARQGTHVPIIALTANALVGDREKCLEAGMDAFLSKPFQLQELADALKRWHPAVIPAAS